MQRRRRIAIWTCSSLAGLVGGLALAVSSGCQPSPTYHYGGASHHPHAAPAPQQPAPPAYHQPGGAMPQSPGTVVSPAESAPMSPSGDPAGQSYSTSPAVPGR